MKYGIHWVTHGLLVIASALGGQPNFLSLEFPLMWLKRQDAGLLAHSCVIGDPSMTLHHNTFVASILENVDLGSDSRPLAGASRWWAMGWAVALWG